MTVVYLLDTNIISELNKLSPNRKVIDNIYIHQKVSGISSIVWAESLYGMKRLPASKRKESLEDFYYDTILDTFTFIPFDEHAASVFSDIKSRLERIGKPAPLMDMQIAATAIANNAILVTRNIEDFDGICEVGSLMVENWFES